MMVNYLKSKIMLFWLILAGIAAAKLIQPPAEENPILPKLFVKSFFQFIFRKSCPETIFSVRLEIFVKDFHPYFPFSRRIR